MNITESQLRTIIRESLIAEIFGLGKKKPEVYKQALKDAGLTDRNIEVAMPNMPDSLAKDKVDPADVTTAVKELLQSPGDHIGGIPGGKAIYKKLKSMGAIK